MEHRHPDALELELQRLGEPTDELVVVVTEDGVEWRECCELLEGMGARDVARVQHAIGVTDRTEHHLGKALREAVHQVRVSKDKGAHRLTVGEGLARRSRERRERPPTLGLSRAKGRARSEMAELSYPPGTPSWVDVASPELARTRAFYLGLFDWDVEEDKDTEGCFFFAAGSLVAGAYAVGAGTPSLWNSYITVSDADGAAAAALVTGGSVVQAPRDVGGRGRMAVLADPGGAVISVWQPGGIAGAELVNAPGAFCWNELQTSAIETSKPFYRAVFGWDERTSDFGGVSYTEWLRAGESVAGMMAMPPGTPAGLPPFWLVYFAVEDCADAVVRAEAIGATVLVPPFASPAGRFAVLQDPVGASFAVIAFSD